MIPHTQLGECSIRLCRYFPELELLIARFRGSISAREWVEFWVRMTRRLEGSGMTRALVDVRGCDAPDRPTVEALSDISGKQDLATRSAFLVDPDGFDMIDAVIAYRSGFESEHEFIICESLVDASAFLEVELEPMLANLEQIESWRTL